MMINSLFYEQQNNLNFIALSLQNEQKFAEDKRQLFSQTLKKLTLLISEEKPYLIKIAQTSLKQTVICLSELKKIEKKLTTIRGSIFAVTSRRPFFIKINDVVLPLLAQTRQIVIKELKSHQRLPFHYHQAWQDYEREAKQEMGLERIEEVTEEHVIGRQKDVFHLLADRMDVERTEQLDTDLLEGNYPLQSTLSYERLLKAMMEDRDAKRKDIYGFLLERIRFARAIATKFSFATEMKANDSLDCLEGYYDDLVSGREDFQQKYALSLTNRFIPLDVILNDICLDIMQMIDEIKPGDLRLFSTGSQGHHVLVQIARLQPTASFPQGEYRYTVINTGEGADQFHHAIETDQGDFIKPVVIKGMKREDFTYTFLEYLVKHPLTKGSTMKSFYEWHDRLRDNKAVKFDLDSSSPVQEQKWGTCTYLPFDVWIDSYLTKEEKIRKEELKASFSLANIENIIPLVKQERTQRVWKEIKKSQRNKRIKVPLMRTSIDDKRVQETLKLKEFCLDYQKSLSSLKT